MNPLISPTSSLFLPLSQLNPHCTRLLNSLSDGGTSQKERILLEQTLWNEVKKIRALNDTSIFLYLIGYYHTILYQIAKLTAQNDLFQYHVLIRLGDLNRYIDRTDVAEYYYCNARNLFPYFGHAYNQLGLLTKPTNCYKCCYYYARAAKSSDKPLHSIADSNLRIAVSKYDCEVLNYILNDEACISVNESVLSKLPTAAFEWFYVIVVAIYADNIQPIVKSFLSHIVVSILYDNFQNRTSTRSLETVAKFLDRDSYILLSNLDMLLDWIKLGSQGKVILPAVSSKLREIKICLQFIIASLDSGKPLHHSGDGSNDNSSRNSTSVSSIMDTTTTSTRFLATLSNSTSQDSTFTSATDSSSKSSSPDKQPALPHDYILRGFGPLDSVHIDLDFKQKFEGKRNLDDNSMSDSGTDKNFINTGQLLQLLLRISKKIDGFGPSLRRKQTRNIALESILSSLDRTNEL